MFDIEIKEKYFTQQTTALNNIYMYKNNNRKLKLE